MIAAFRKPNSFSSVQEIAKTYWKCGQLNDIAFILRKIYQLWNAIEKPKDSSNLAIYNYMEEIEKNKELVTVLLKSTIDTFDEVENTIQILGRGVIGAVVTAVGAIVLLSSIIITLPPLIAVSVCGALIATGGYFAFQAYQRLKTMRDSILIVGSPLITSGAQLKRSSPTLTSKIYTPIQYAFFSQIPPQLDSQALRANINSAIGQEEEEEGLSTLLKTLL